MARSPVKVVRDGNEKVVTDNNTFAGPNRPVSTGPACSPSGYQTGLPISDGIVKRINATGSKIPARISEVSPDFGPTPKPSDPV